MSDTSGFQHLKIWLIGVTGLSKDALHVHFGLALFVGAMLVFRWRPGSWKPLAVVVVAALLGEAWDLRDAWASDAAIDLWRNWHDVWNTCLWPVAITLLARFAPRDSRA